MRAYTNGSYTMQNQSFRVQVWASNGSSAGMANELFSAVRSAVLGSSAYKMAAPESRRLSVDGGEWSAHFAIQKPDVKPVDDSETLIVEFDNAQMLCVTNIQFFPYRIDRSKCGIMSFAYDVEGVPSTHSAGRKETRTYVVGRNGVTAIRIERGSRRG